MTKTPLEEFLDSVVQSGGSVTYIDVDSLPVSRADMIKSLWNRAILEAPEGATMGDDGLVASLPDPWEHDGRIVFEIITYGTKRVIEAEGVVVCHLLT